MKEKHRIRFTYCCGAVIIISKVDRVIKRWSWTKLAVGMVGRVGTVTDAESGATCQLKLMHSSLVGSAGQVQVEDFMAQYTVIPFSQKEWGSSGKEYGKHKVSKHFRVL